MIKRIIRVLIVIIFILGILAWFFVRNNKPIYSGKLDLEKLRDSVSVYFDEVGVPHIYANNTADAYLALGYLHAQDRLWQMELMRRIGPGRLSEIFGKDMIQTDKLFRGMGIELAAKKSLAKIDTNSISFQYARAYLDGVNQFITHGKTPIEFRLLGIEKETYTILDIYNVFGYMSFGFAQAYKTDPLLTDLHEKLGSLYLRDLDVNNDPRTTLIKNYTNGIEKRSAGAISKQINELTMNLPIPPFVGSNSWVIGSKKTKEKGVILANDPHIEFSQPSVWYQAHIKSPDYEMYGFHLALTPFPLLAHNRDFAYGLTMFQNDDLNFYYESGDFLERKEIIKVKGEDDVEFIVKTGKKGPIMNNLFKGLDSTKSISMDWIYTKSNNDLLDVTYLMSHAKSLSEFKSGVSKIHAPGLNVMYGDKNNNIAWFAAAKLFRFSEEIDTKFILDPAYSNSEINLLGFDQNPQAINPPWNYVYSANNQPEEIENGYYPGYYLPEDRAKRIVQLLSDKNDFSKSDVEKMILDNTSSVVPGLVRTVLGNLTKVNFSENENKALEILKNWDGSYTQKSIAPSIYNLFLYHFASLTFKDEMGDDYFQMFLNTHLFKRQIAKQIKNLNSIWWDDISTKEYKENRDEIFTNAFHKTIQQLEKEYGDNLEEWTWDQSLSVTHKHAFDKVAVLRPFFNVGPFKTDGGNEVLNNQIFYLNDIGKYQVKAGPSTRRIIDFSDIENSSTIIPTGQSGNIFSKHYKDQAEKYHAGEFVKMKLNEAEIKQAKDVLILYPKKD
ncbi:penicillin acylase family protein [Namhaeicola litoreus]|uniref:Penicillin acylase family protein n=1 Tax=Namhaeicola litoreus TaxID=1052145 RepID=A0ABW3XY33_9FLAO